MNDDDDLLHDFDLSVWDAPAAPANLAEQSLDELNQGR